MHRLLVWTNVILLASLVVFDVSATHVSCPLHPDCTFSGIAADLNPGAPLQLLVVHGMGPHDSAYSSELIKGVSALLRFSLQSEQPEVTIPPLDPAHTPSKLRISTWRAGDGRSVIVYAVQWSPLVDRIKAEQLGYDWNERRMGVRARLNGALKKDLIDLRLADPILYLGLLHREMQHPIRFTLCAMVGGTIAGGKCDTSQSRASASPLAVVTYSLGSRMTFDVLSEMASQSEAGRGLIRRMTHVYMLANQLPLLDLAEAEAGGLPAPSGSLSGVLNVRQSLDADRGLVGRLTVVAINDPNDLLSYDISDDFAKRYAATTFVNADVRLVRNWFGIANPLGAHTSHDRNSTVLRLIVFGNR